MITSYFTASSFNKSIEKALAAPNNTAASISRISRIIRKLPDGRLYAVKRGCEVAFHVLVNGHQKYVPKKSKDTLMLARKTYLLLLLEILKLTESPRKQDLERRKRLIRKLQRFISLCEGGNLDIARIVLTSRQYKWFTGQFRQKHIDLSSALFTASGLPVRSKSERDIANACELLAVPFHYEEQIQVYAHDLVMKLEDQLRQENKLHGPVYSFRGDSVYWNVPPELEWMNTRGSIWKSYYPPTGKIIMHNDFKIMLANDEIIIWEHEGLMEDFVYRCNATERTAIMKYTGTISKSNLIETFESEVDTLEKREAIIEEYILPRLWF